MFNFPGTSRLSSRFGVMPKFTINTKVSMKRFARGYLKSKVNQGKREFMFAVGAYTMRKARGKIRRGGNPTKRDFSLLLGKALSRGTKTKYPKTWAPGAPYRRIGFEVQNLGTRVMVGFEYFGGNPSAPEIHEYGLSVVKTVPILLNNRKKRATQKSTDKQIKIRGRMRSVRWVRRRVKYPKRSVLEPAQEEVISGVASGKIKNLPPLIKGSII